MSRLTRAHWTVLGAGLGVLGLVIGIVWYAERREAMANRDPRGSSGMTGMPGMDMPMGSGGMRGGGTIQLTTAQTRQFGITFGAVEHRTLTTELRVPGSVVLDETRVVQVALKFGGWVERLHARVTGEFVRAGQPLMEVYSPEVFAALQELLVAERLERTGAAAPIPGLPRTGSDLVSTARRRLALLGVGDRDVERTLQAGEAPRTVTAYAPNSGILTERMVTQGQAIQAGQTLFTIADLSGVWVNAEVRETDAALLRTGVAAEVELASMPGRPFRGVVTYVYPTLNPQTRTVVARVAVANTAGQVRPGMYAIVQLRAPSRRALTIPSSAVVRTGERAVVFVDLGGGRIEPQEVEIGRTTSEYTEVLAGLEPGQRVVTSAQFLLDSESNLADVMRSMIGQGMSMSDMQGMDNMPGMDMGGQPTDKGARPRP